MNDQDERHFNMYKCAIIEDDDSYGGAGWIPAKPNNIKEPTFYTDTSHKKSVS
jgi:hypothetical protein